MDGWMDISNSLFKCTFMEQLLSSTTERGPEGNIDILAQNQLMCNLFHSAQSWHSLRRSRKTSLYPFNLTELSNKDKHRMHFVATDTAGGGKRRETACDTALL